MLTDRIPLNLTAPLFILFAFIPSITPADGTWRVIQSFDAPSTVPGGLAWDGAYLWHSQWHNNTLYKLDSRNGNTLGSLTTDIGYQEDMVFHGGSLYVCDGTRNLIERINPSTGTLEETLTFDWSPYPRDFAQSWGYILNGLTSDGRFLWANLGGVWCLQIDPATRQIVHHWKRRFGAVNDYMDGMAMAWGSLFIATNGSNIFEVDPCTGAMISQFKAPAGQGLGPEGLTFDGEYLWYTDNTSDKIYKIELVDDYLTRARIAARTAITCGDQAEIQIAPGVTAGLNLFPNPLPRNRPLSITIDGNTDFKMAMKIRIVDLSGRKIWEDRINPGTRPLVMPHVFKSKQGFLIFKCSVGRQTFSSKFLVLK